MADVACSAHASPVAALLLQQLPDFDVEGCAHGASIAKLCGLHKQHFATPSGKTSCVSSRSINVVVSEALAYYMGERWNNTTRARAAGVAPNTIANCLAPDRREPSKSGKEPSVKVTELAKIAHALGGVEVADLVTDMPPDERAKLWRKRAADYYAEHGVLPAWAPEHQVAGPAAASGKRQRAVA